MKIKKYIGTAPGRMDVMGGIADYSGSLVLQKQIKETTEVSFLPRQDGLIIAKTFSSEEISKVFIVEVNTLLLPNGEVDLTYARQQFKSTTGGSWAAYVVGCLLVLKKYKNIQLTGGEFEIRSQIPEGKGVSSSAALEIATMKALASAYSVHFDGTELATLAQIVENEIVGAPCGLMDQLACAYGNPNTLLPILCQPDKLYQNLEIPEYINFIGIDSGLRHHVGGASYSDVRAAAFMGHSIVAQLYYEVSADTLLYARQNRDFSQVPNGSYLCNLSFNKYKKDLETFLPDSISGELFYEQYKVSVDKQTQIINEKNYNIKASVAHAIGENDRIGKFYEIFKSFGAKPNHSLLEQAGAFMYQSHESYNNVGLGSYGTDKLVQMAAAPNYDHIFGAKITGGGSGGTVCFMCLGEQGIEQVMSIHENYQKQEGKETKLFF